MNTENSGGTVSGKDTTTPNTNPASPNRQETIDRIGAILDGHEERQLSLDDLGPVKIHDTADRIIKLYPHYRKTDDVVGELVYQQLRPKGMTRNLVSQVLNQKAKPKLTTAARSLSDIGRMTIDTPRWLIEHVVRAGTMNTVVGQSKAGKSRLSLEIVESIVTGRPFLGEYAVEVTGPVWMFTSDDDEDELYRVTQEWMHHRAIPTNAPVRQLVHYPMELTSHEDVRDLIDQLNELPEGEKPVLVVIDSVYNFTAESDDNERSDMKRLYGVFMKRICHETGVALLCIEHAAKSQGEGANAVIGSQAKGAALRSGITVTLLDKDATDPKTGRRVAEVKLSRWGNTGWQWEDVYHHDGELYSWTKLSKSHLHTEHALVARVKALVDAGETVKLSSLVESRSEYEKTERLLARVGFKVETLSERGKPKGIVGYTMEHKVQEFLDQEGEPDEASVPTII